MKKVTITISFDEENLSAPKMYLTQRGVQVESEPERSLETLYTKTVPNNPKQKRFSYKDIFLEMPMKILVDFT